MQIKLNPTYEPGNFENDGGEVIFNSPEIPHDTRVEWQPSWPVELNFEPKEEAVLYDPFASLRESQGYKFAEARFIMTGSDGGYHPKSFRDDQIPPKYLMDAVDGEMTVIGYNATTGQVFSMEVTWDEHNGCWRDENGNPVKLVVTNGECYVIYQE